QNKAEGFAHVLSLTSLRLGQRVRRDASPLSLRRAVVAAMPPGAASWRRTGRAETAENVQFSAFDPLAHGDFRQRFGITFACGKQSPRAGEIKTENGGGGSRAGRCREI